jgi:hypothetical protein
MLNNRGYLAAALLATLIALANPARSQTATATITATSTGFTINIQSGSESVAYQWVAPATGSLWTIGSVLITDSVAGASPQGQIALGSHIDWIGPAGVLQSVTFQTTGSPTATLAYVSSSGTTHLTLQPAFDGNFAIIRLSADQANIQDIYLGQLPSGLTTQGISVPYYDQAVNYFSSLNLFENSYFDGFASSASSLTNMGTFYAANENGIANALTDTWRVSVSQNIMNVLPFPEHPASPYMSRLAGRMVFDIGGLGGGPFATIASELAHLGDYDVNHCVVIIGDWQYLGYDNGLPMQYPANVALGGSTGMRLIGSAAQANSCFFALHENYTDYYPDYPEYNPAATMRNPDGGQTLAWLNTTTGIQSFAAKPGLFVTNAQTQSPLIHKEYGTNATFIDVNSSATPSWRQDYDPATAGSATFGAYRNGSVALWAYERNVERGPVLGEGKYHWYWSGLLDSVEAQFGAESTPITNGLQAPLFVDFDLMRIHPLQVNYGMGYYERWMPGGTTITSTTALDAYRMQEVIFGHSPYLTGTLWPSVPRSLLEQNLVSPLSTRYALQTPIAIAYNVNGAWADASTAAIAGEFSVVQVSYPNGDTIIANSGSSNVTWNGIQIPQYGWAAAGNNFAAYTALVGTQVADYSQTSSMIYANARNQADILSENTLATPSVAAFSQIGTNAIQIQLAWDVNTAAPGTAYQEFVHLVSGQAPVGSNTVSGATGGPTLIPTGTWTVGEHVVDSVWTFYLPPTMPDGTYEVRVGLFTGNQRVVCYGNNDGNLRYTVGQITVSNNGANIVFTSIPIVIPSPDPRMNSTGAVVNFGSVLTDGMVTIQQTGQNSGTLQLSSYPRSRDVVIQINSTVVAMPSSLTCDNGDVIIPVASGNYWQVDLRARKYCTWSGTL